MSNLDLGLFNLREFPLVTEVFSSKRQFEGMPSNPLSILNVSIRSPRCLLSSRVVRFKYFRAEEAVDRRLIIEVHCYYI